MARDPKFLIVKHDRYTIGINEANLILFNSEGDIILRNTEKLLNKFEASIEILRFPEYFQLVSAEKYSWYVYVTNERLICASNLYGLRGAYELMDHVDNYSTLGLVEQTGTESIGSVFKLVEKRKKDLKEYSIAFQIAYSRLSSISVSKIEHKRTGNPIPGAIEMWYKDSLDATDSQIVIYPTNLSFEDPYKHALAIHINALEEKLRCVERKHQIDTSFSKGDYNSWESTLSRLLKKPDMLAQGSGDLHSESWDPLIFQSHPIQWLSDVFSHSITSSDKVNTSM